MTDDRKQINVRIPAELCKKIENEGRQKQEVVSDALELYFSSNSNIDVAKDLEHEKEKNRILEANVRALEQQLGFLQQEYSKLSRVNEQLLLKPAPEEIQKKAWWQFWK